MFDGEETTAIVVLITDGHEVFAMPAQRTGNFTYEVKRGMPAEKLELGTMVAVALSIEGAECPD